MDLEKSKRQEFYFDGPGEAARSVLLEVVDSDIVVSQRFSDGQCLVGETSERFRLVDVENVANKGDRLVVTLKAGFLGLGKRIAFQASVN